MSKYGRAPSGQALVASDGAQLHGLHPAGFDPSRDETRCPYELTNERAIEQAMAWHEGYRAALRWVMETTR